MALTCSCLVRLRNPKPHEYFPSLCYGLNYSRSDLVRISGVYEGNFKAVRCWGEEGKALIIRSDTCRS